MPTVFLWLGSVTARSERAKKGVSGGVTASSSALVEVPRYLAKAVNSALVEFSAGLGIGRAPGHIDVLAKISDKISIL